MKNLNLLSQERFESDITCWLFYSFELTDVSPSLMGHMAYPAFGMADWFPARAGLPILILMF